MSENDNILFFLNLSSFKNLNLCKLLGGGGGGGGLKPPQPPPVDTALFDMVNVKGIVYNIAALETPSKDKYLEFKKVSLKYNTGSMRITFYIELTKQLKEGKCYSIIEFFSANKQ